MQISQDLIKACKRKDRLSQKALYLKLLPYLRAVCRRYLYRENYLNDVLQESFVLIFNKIDTFDLNKGDFKKWAVRICINNSLNFNKKQHLKLTELTISEHDIPQLPQAYHQMSNEAILVFLKQMPKSYYQVFNMVMVDGYDHNEIAKMLDIDAALSRKRLSRAREWLKKALGKDANNFNFQST